VAYRFLQLDGPALEQLVIDLLPEKGDGAN